MCYSEVRKLFEVPETDQSHMRISFLTIVIVTLLNRGASSRGVQLFPGTRQDAGTKSRTKRRKKRVVLQRGSSRGQ